VANKPESSDDVQEGKIKSILAEMSDDEVKQLIKDAGGITAAARVLQVYRTNLCERLIRMGVTLDNIMYEKQQEIAPDLLEDQVKVEGDCVITADYHSPFTSLQWLDRVVWVGKKEKIKQLLIVGDLFDFDRLSWWLKQSNAEDIAVSLEDELCFTEMIMEKLESQFNKIHLLGGNHWMRLLKALTFSISNKRILGLVGHKDDSKYITHGLFNWTLIDNKVRVTHPARARKLDYTLARDLSILHIDQWVLVAHRHRSNTGFSPDGRPIWEIGWLGDVERMRYVQYTDSTYYTWVNGFAFWKDGAMHNLTDFNYDWPKEDK